MTGAPRRDAALRSVRVARGVRARVELQIIRGSRGVRTPPQRCGNPAAPFRGPLFVQESIFHGPTCVLRRALTDALSGRRDAERGGQPPAVLASGPRERVVRRHRRYGTFTSPRGFRASGYRR